MMVACLIGFPFRPVVMIGSELSYRTGKTTNPYVGFAGMYRQMMGESMFVCWPLAKQMDAGSLQ